MNSTEYQYDVAFSFTQQDEDLAYKIYSLLKDRLTCFIYSEEQKKLAGGDGELIFNKVFTKETRIVVILYRAEYGNTKWTRIEETAIRNRGYDEGYDFVILIPLDKKAQPPKWLPKTRLWVGLERWGIESAASVIEARVQEYGGTVKIETIADFAARSEIEIIEKQKREIILNSNQALAITNEEIKKLKLSFKALEEETIQKTQNWIIKSRDNKHNGIDIMSYGYFLTFHYYQQWANTIQDAYLYIALFNGYFDENGNLTDPFAQPRNIDSIKLRFDIDKLNQNGWSILDTRTNFVTSQKLAETWFSKLIKFATEGKQERGY